jgi:hypothetical protein
MGNTISNTPPPAARGNTQKTSAAEQTNAWQSVLDTAVGRMTDSEVKGSLKYLGDGRIDGVKQKVKDEMEAFVRDNPNASVDEIKKKADETTSKHETNAVFNKMRDDNFFNKLMSRRKELLKDMWG